MLIIHGDNLIQSRLKLKEAIEQKKAPGVSLIRLDGSTLNRAELESHFLAKSLFGDAKLVVIENLFSLPKSKKKEELIELIISAGHNQELSSQVIIWESKAVTVTTLKKIDDAQVLEFKTSPVVFKWLDSLNGHQQQTELRLKLLSQAVHSDGSELCLALLARQIRLLIQAAEKKPLAAPPFVVKKLNQQANSFSLAQLIKIHHQLVQIDREIKSSQLHLSLEKKLDLLTMNM